MAYSGIDDIRALLPEAELAALTDDEGLGAVNAGRVADAIAEADAVIDAYCGARYAVPFADTPPLLAKLSAELAASALYCRRAIKVPEARAERSRDALKLLGDIARGVASLGVENTPGAASSSASVNRSAKDTLFTRKSMEGF